MVDQQDRNDITEMCYPDKITAKEFTEEIKKNLEAFRDNMNELHNPGEPRYPEEWMGMFSAWMELFPRK